MAHLFHGTGVALVTPFKQDTTIDYNALGKLIEHVIDGGVNFLVALGTTAETPTLTPEEKKEVLASILAYNAGRVPVVCGIGGNDTAAVVEALKTCDLSDIAGILSVVPYYNKPTQEGIYQHFKTIASNTEKPIILYNVPGRTGSSMSAATTLKLASEFSHIVAVKEASGNMSQCMDLVQGKPAHFTVLSGDDDLVVPQIAIGMEGVISVAANCFTHDFTTMVNAALAQDYTLARQLHYKLLDAIRLLFTEGNPAGVKCVLHEMELGENHLRLPLVPVSRSAAEQISVTVARLSRS